MSFRRSSVTIIFFNSPAEELVERTIITIMISSDDRGQYQRLIIQVTLN